VFLGFFARLTFGGDIVRFEFAQTAVDHFGSLLGVVLTALFVALLAQILSADTVETAAVAQTIPPILMWAAALYLIRYLLALALPGTLWQIAHAPLAALCAVWLLAVALSQQHKEQKEEFKQRPGVITENEVVL